MEHVILGNVNILKPTQWAGSGISSLEILKTRVTLPEVEHPDLLGNITL